MAAWSLLLPFCCIAGGSCHCLHSRAVASLAGPVMLDICVLCCLQQLPVQLLPLLLLLLSHLLLQAHLELWQCGQ
jgi:hypothetical protein